jgi:hypothetical protein
MTAEKRNQILRSHSSRLLYRLMMPPAARLRFAWRKLTRCLLMDGVRRGPPRGCTQSSICPRSALCCIGLSSARIPDGFALDSGRALQDKSVGIGNPAGYARH